MRAGVSAATAPPKVLRPGREVWSLNGSIFDAITVTPRFTTDAASYLPSLVLTDSMTRACRLMAAHSVSSDMARHNSNPVGIQHDDIPWYLLPIPNIGLVNHRPQDPNLAVINPTCDAQKLRSSEAHIPKDTRNLANRRAPIPSPRVGQGVSAATAICIGGHPAGPLR